MTALKTDNVTTIKLFVENNKLTAKTRFKVPVNVGILVCVILCLYLKSSVKGLL